MCYGPTMSIDDQMYELCAKTAAWLRELRLELAETGSAHEPIARKLAEMHAAMALMVGAPTQVYKIDPRTWTEREIAKAVEG